MPADNEEQDPDQGICNSAQSKTVRTPEKHMLERGLYAQTGKTPENTSFHPHRI
jgi:hypothetical protein